MKKPAIVLFFAAFLSLSALAQTVQDGIYHLYAQRFQSARSAFEKLLAANPNNIEATYWLGQTHIAQKNVAAARQVFEKALVANGNAPLLLVGMGQVELMEGKAGEARSRFENAINASRGKKGNDANVLNAIGRANVMAYTDEKKLGDLDYAIAKLKEASSLAPNNPDIFLNLGNAYRKKGNMGGDAVQAYRQAATINPSLAIAPYRTALLYKTQISYRQPDAWTVVLENLNKAIKADPKFAPAYEELYYYNLLAKSDFPTAENLAKQYISFSDPSPENSSLEMQIKNLQKKYSEVISIGKNIIQQTNNNARPIVYRIMAFAHMGIKDTVSACEYVNQFFTKATDEDLLSSDYILRAYACGRGNPNVIRESIVQAVKQDSGSLTRQRRTIQEFIDDAKANGNKIFEAELRMMDYQLRMDAKQPTSPTELISYMAVPFYLGGAYQRADSISQEYSKLAPDSIYGYYWSALSQQALDTPDMKLGLSVANFQKSLDIAMTDTVRFQTQGVKAASTLAVYYVNVKKDVATAKDYVEKGLKFDANNANLKNFQQILNNAGRQRPATPAQKTSSSNGQAKDVKVKKEGGTTKVKKD
jgi:tetratricopeptide (TPR) repeat protein